LHAGFDLIRISANRPDFGAKQNLISDVGPIDTLCDLPKRVPDCDRMSAAALRVSRSGCARNAIMVS
jgi:hypothetical protein